MPEALPPEFAAALHASARRRGSIGEPTWYFSETSSTNDVAATLAEHGAPEGTAVIASAQTAGRGRMGREWHSPPGGGLYVSIVFRDPRLAPMLTLAGGVAVADGIHASTGLPVEIKWPNDVVVREGGSRSRRLKLAGILAEASSGADGLQHVILGFGINVRPAPYPPELAGVATCIETELGRPADPAAVLAETLANLHSQVERLASGDTAAVLNRWRALAPLAVGSTVEWDRASIKSRGTTAGIDDEGALLVRAGDGTERIVSGAVRWL
jgi:BirA family transcriptional regulator, biotin operon repressor / biotin---[acetyl-CoA-carboxylase] ligase